MLYIANLLCSSVKSTFVLSHKLTVDGCKFQGILGSLPEGFDHYFASRFPKLLIEVYKVLWVHCKDEEAFSKHFNGSSL
jgi:hypothetical protein